MTRIGTFQTYKKCKGCSNKVLSRSGYCKNCVKLFYKAKHVVKYNQFEEDGYFVHDGFNEILTHEDLKSEIGLKEKGRMHE